MADLEKQTRSCPPSEHPYPRANSPDSKYTSDEKSLEEEDITIIQLVDSYDEVPSSRQSTLDEKPHHIDSDYLVRWDGPNDPENPKNWSKVYRWYITMAAGLILMNASFASSAPSGILGQLIEEFHLSHTLAVLVISLFVLGYCVGPLLWGPLSEQYGRKAILLVAFFGFTAFSIASTFANTATQVLVFRFLGGTFAAAPLTTSGAIVADVWNPDVRGKAMSFFVLAPFAGPTLAPIVSGYIEVGGASWRWLFVTLAVFSGFCFFLILLTIPETYAPTIQTRKAAKKRKETGDDQWYSELEAQNLRFGERVEQILTKPFKVLVSEPMLIVVALYMSFVYGSVYLLFEAYPIVFTQGHHLNAGQSGLMFLPLLIGAGAACVAYTFYFNPKYEAEMLKYAPKVVPPEYRLIPAFYGAPLFMISFFWFGWTSFPNISLWAPLMSGLFMGIGIILIYLALFNYIVDAYLVVAASALASNTVIRSLFGAIFPLFATAMFEKLTPRWASTLLGLVALFMIPIPFVLYRYGRTIRRTSKYAPNRE